MICGRLCAAILLMSVVMALGWRSIHDSEHRSTRLRPPDSAAPSTVMANSVPTDLPAATSAAVLDSGGGADNIQVVHP